MQHSVDCGIYRGKMCDCVAGKGGISLAEMYDRMATENQKLRDEIVELHKLLGEMISLVEARE